MKFNFFKRKQVEDYKPCILDNNQIKNLSDTEILKIYKPAIKKDGVNISLSNDPSIKLPSSTEELRALKADLRYVWCDGYEASSWQSRQCKYLGIRITKSFILHETIWYTWGEYINQICQKCQSRFLIKEEMMLLDLVWNEVSAMRKKAGDAPLPRNRYRYWIYDKNGKFPHDTYAHVTRNGTLLDRGTETDAQLFMAVSN